VIEFGGADDAAVRGILEGHARELPPGEPVESTDAAVGSLAADAAGSPPPDPNAGEPA
jgi:hypothetical protein